MVSLIVTSLAFASSAFDDEAEALAKARAFRNIAATANGAYTDAYRPAFALKSTDHSADEYHFEFVDGGVRLRRSDHLIVGFSFSPPDEAQALDTWDEQNAIGDSAAISLGYQYILASGSGPFVHKYLYRNENAIGHAEYTLTYYPTYQNIIYHPDYDIYVGIEYNTGRLLLFARSADLPNPPASLQVSIPLETALYNFISYVADHFGVSYLNGDFAELVIWNPKLKDVYPNQDNLPLSVRNLIGTNNSTLAYMFSAVQPSMGTSEKPEIALFEGYVDPVTGAVWSVIRLTPFGGGGGQPGLLRWDLGVGAITVSNGKQSIEIKDADVDRAPTPKKFTPSSKLILRRAKVVVVIEYDRNTGLIRTSQTEMHSYGKPSHNLKRALDQLTR